MNELQLILAISTLVIISVISSRISDKFGVPALIIFLIIGMLAGSEGPGGIYFDDPKFAKSLGTIALVLILFYGGVDTNWKKTKPVLFRGSILATFGVLLTAVILAGLSMLLLKFSLMEGLLVGAIVSSTDAAAVFSVLRSKNVSLKGDIKPLLEFESGVNDPMAVFLTIGLISMLQPGGTTALQLIPKFFVEMLIGISVGLAVGKILIYLINRIKLDHEGLYPVLGLAFVIFDYAIATFLHGNGFLSAYVTGLVVGNSEFVHKKTLIRFHSGLAWLMQIAMFLTLGLLIFPSKVLPVMSLGLLLSVLLMLIARPLSVFICLIGSKYTFKEKLMVSWVGLRGAVPIILAIFPLIAGVPKADEIFNVVFFIVITSALVQGSLIPPVSKWLGVYEPIKSKNKYPIEFDNMPGMEAELQEVFIPFNSMIAGNSVFDIGIPKEALVTLVSRDDKFIIPNGSTVIEGGDVLLVLADKKATKEIEGKVNKLKDKETIEKEEKIQEEHDRQMALEVEKVERENRQAEEIRKAELEKGKDR